MEIDKGYSRANVTTNLALVCWNKSQIMRASQSLSNDGWCRREVSALKSSLLQVG